VRSAVISAVFSIILRLILLTLIPFYYTLCKREYKFINQLPRGKQCGIVIHFNPKTAMKGGLWNLVAGAGTSLHRLIAEISVFSEIYRDSRKLEKVS